MLRLRLSVTTELAFPRDVQRRRGIHRHQQPYNHQWPSSATRLEAYFGMGRESSQRVDGELESVRNKTASKKNPGARVAGVPWRVVDVKALPGHRLKVRFADGVAGEVDVSRMVFGANPGVFEALRDPEVFNRVYIEGSAVAWPGNLDLAPDAMHDEIEANGQWVLDE